MKHRNPYFKQISFTLFRSLHYLFILSILISALPFQPYYPLWYIRIVDSSISNIPILLVAIFICFCHFLVEDDSSSIHKKSRHFSLILSMWLGFYSVILPLQFLCTGWFIVATKESLQNQIIELGKTRDGLKTLVQLSPSSDGLKAILDRNSFIPQPLSISPLADQKQAVIESIDSRFSQMIIPLRSQKSKVVVDLLPGVLRASIGGVIIIYTLLTIKKYFLKTSIYSKY